MLLNKFQIPRSILLSICLIPNLQSHISNDHLHRLEAKSKILIPHFTCLNSKFSFSSLHAQTQSSHPPLHMHMLKLKILILQSTYSKPKSSFSQKLKTKTQPPTPHAQIQNSQPQSTCSNAKSSFSRLHAQTHNFQLQCLDVG